MYHVHVVSAEAVRRYQISWTTVTEVCELPCGCWVSSPGPLEEQSKLSSAEPSLHPSQSSCKILGAREYSVQEDTFCGALVFNLCNISKMN